MIATNFHDSGEHQDRSSIPDVYMKMPVTPRTSSVLSVPCSHDVGCAEALCRFQK